MAEQINVENLSGVSQMSVEEAEQMIGRPLRVKTTNADRLVKVICKRVDVCGDKIMYICKSRHGHTVGLYRDEFDILPQK